MRRLIFLMEQIDKPVVGTLLSFYLSIVYYTFFFLVFIQDETYTMFIAYYHKNS